MSNLELWGGIEATVNRIEDRYINQLELSGHLSRPDDLHKITSLGIKKLRYPVNWELFEDDLSWPEERLNLLRELGIEPIVTLIHHGSGPKYTDLTDEKFPLHLANYAKKVAKKFPWVKYYTPVNEPLTTARFSGLYGVWYPHTRDDMVFGRCLANQYKAILYSMESIREINPNAVLVQTEDLGKTYCTPSLQYQADHENERRWLTFDVLTGRLEPSDRMYEYLESIGFIDEIYFHNINPIENIILGIDTYITSPRFLDERWELYPEHLIGGNGIDRYADVEATRVMENPIPEIDEFLQETWERYHEPVAITEAHIDSDDAQRISWFSRFWNGALKAKENGVDVRGVAYWALIGMYGWDKLSTGESEKYEAGAFRIDAGQLCETEVCKALRQAAMGLSIESAIKGWWERDDRFTVPPFSLCKAIDRSSL
jgi:dTDP-4-dehydrorhamnose reductase